MGLLAGEVAGDWGGIRIRYGVVREEAAVRGDGRVARRSKEGVGQRAPGWMACRYATEARVEEHAAAGLLTALEGEVLSWEDSGLPAEEVGPLARLGEDRGMGLVEADRGLGDLGEAGEEGEGPLRTRSWALGEEERREVGQEERLRVWEVVRRRGERAERRQGERAERRQDELGERLGGDLGLELGLGREKAEMLPRLRPPRRSSSRWAFPQQRVRPAEAELHRSLLRQPFHSVEEELSVAVLDLLRLRHPHQQARPTVSLLLLERSCRQSWLLSVSVRLGSTRGESCPSYRHRRNSNLEPQKGGSKKGGRVTRGPSPRGPGPFVPLSFATSSSFLPGLLWYQMI